MSRELTLVRQPQAETAAQRTARLQAEARFAACAQVDDFISLLGRAVADAKDIAEGGDAFPPGVRDLCRRLAEELPWKAQTLAQIVEKG